MLTQSHYILSFMLQCFYYYQYTDTHNGLNGVDIAIFCNGALIRIHISTFMYIFCEIKRREMGCHFIS